MATRTDTPFNADGLTQMITAVDGRSGVPKSAGWTWTHRVGSFTRTTRVEPDATIRQLLTHTSGAPENLTYAYRPERLAPLWPILRTCTVDSYRESFANLLERLAMVDSVPGSNIVTVVPPAEGMPTPADVERYTAVLQRQATPYAVDDRGRATHSSYPESAAVADAVDAARSPPFAILRNSISRCGREFSSSPETLDAGVERARHATGGLALPHGMGWFVQSYNGEKVVWQFGMAENASSSLMITLPARGLTLILMANSDGLVKLYSPANGDVSVSPFAKLFLSLFVR